MQKKMKQKINLISDTSSTFVIYFPIDILSNLEFIINLNNIATVDSDEAISLTMEDDLHKKEMML